MSARASSVFLATLVLAGMILAVPSIAGQETGGDLSTSAAHAAGG